MEGRTRRAELKECIVCKEMSYKILYIIVCIYFTVCPMERNYNIHEYNKLCEWVSIKRVLLVIFSRRENDQTCSALYVIWWDHMVFICLPYCCRFMTSILFSVYTVTGVHHPTKWCHSAAIMWCSWIHLAWREIIAICWNLETCLLHLAYK